MNCVGGKVGNENFNGDGHVLSFLKKIKGFPLLFHGPFSTAPPVYGADLLEISSQLILVKSSDTSWQSGFPFLPDIASIQNPERSGSTRRS